MKSSTGHSHSSNSTAANERGLVSAQEPAAENAPRTPASSVARLEEVEPETNAVRRGSNIGHALNVPGLPMLRTAANAYSGYKSGFQRRLGSADSPKGPEPVSSPATATFAVEPVSDLPSTGATPEVRPLRVSAAKPICYRDPCNDPECRRVHICNCPEIEYSHLESDHEH